MGTIEPFVRVISMTPRLGLKVLPAQEFFETQAKSRFGGTGRPRHQKPALKRGGELRRLAEETARFILCESGKSRSLEVSSIFVGSFNQVLYRIGQLCRQAETQMNGGE